MSDWNFADVWETVAAAHPDRPALVQGDRRLSWAELDRRASVVAALLSGAGVGHQAKVAQYLYNCPEYIESVFGAFKASAVPVNTNYRYTEDELLYLWDNADAEVVIFHGAFSERIEKIRSRLDVRLWLWVEDASGGCPEWATRYEDALAEGAGGDVGGVGGGAGGVGGGAGGGVGGVGGGAGGGVGGVGGGAGGDEGGRKGRSGDDLLFIYTGGTTGMPKGVMWRQDDLFAILNRSADVRYPEDGGLDDVRAALTAPSKYPPPRLLPGPPLMHGTGLFTAMSAMASGGAIVMPPSRHLDVPALLDLIQAERVTEISIVGDAFAKPILAALDAEPDRWDLSSLWLIISSGVMWSAEVKEGLLRHNPKLVLIDSLGSSEALGMGFSKSRAGSTASTAGFELGPSAKVITDNGREVEPGSGEQGRVAIRGRAPVGYYKDPEKSAATFAVIDGVRYSIPGDFATVRADGTVQLLGRGSGCINTGGEKVFPEEVEEVLKLHPGVLDAVVVGVPDERFGEAVTAVVELRPSAPAAGPRAEEAEIIEWVKGRLAAYKAPKRVLYVDTIGRSPSGKVDYRRLKDYAADH